MRDVENGAQARGTLDAEHLGKLDLGTGADGAAAGTAAVLDAPPPSAALDSALRKMTTRVVPLTWAVALMNHLDRSK
jgi:hypothetical protein